MPKTDEVSLSGTWQFMPADGQREQLPDPLPQRIEVPGLWEAQGFRELDGPAWYRREFDLDDASGHWTLSFGAVMDTAEVYLNGIYLGSHDGAYTPFAFAATAAVRPGANTLEVRVLDHRLDSREHTRRAHGKQGWMNQVFPSPPSLYMTYGGIWQPVRLLSHGAVTIEDLYVSADPDDVRVEVELACHAPRRQQVTLRVDLLGKSFEQELTLGPGQTHVARFKPGRCDAARWTPSDPVLHDVSAVVLADGDVSHAVTRRIGLRTFRVENDRFVLNGEPFAIRAALVQGFRDDTLYAEGTRSQIEAEVLAAKHAGLNVLRLHIKAFDPVYLDVCDELGMLVHADIPVAEPVTHDELGASGELAQACLRAVREQVRRDRGHPSIVLWSTMNELCAEKQSARRTAGYAAFARMLYDAAVELDHERPIIENDWIEPDPESVFRSPIRTAHWYGRLSGAYLAGLAAKVTAHADGSGPLYVSEFGDWGLPFEEQDAEREWWYGAHLAPAIAALPWGGTVREFLAGTQRYQGISDRLQGEIVRAHGAAGWCLTELTDVPHEYNGLWSLRRQDKPAALAQVSALCQPILPVVLRTDWTVWAGEEITLPVRVCNDGPALASAELTVTIDGSARHEAVISLPQASVAGMVPVTVTVPAQPGDHRIDIEVAGPADASPADVKSSNSYVLHVLEPAAMPAVPLEVVGQPDAEALRGLGAHVTESAATGEAARLLVIGEGALDDRAAARVAATLRDGGRVLVLAQPASAAAYLPVPARGVEIATEWGSTPFLFSTDDGGIRALGTRRVLTTETLAVVPGAVWTDLAGSPWAARTIAGLFKPYPGEITGTVVGAVPVGRGQLWLCQLPLIAAAAGQPTARSVLSDLLTLSVATSEG